MKPTERQKLRQAVAELVNDLTCLQGRPCPDWAAKIATGEGNALELAKAVLS